MSDNVNPSEYESNGGGDDAGETKDESERIKLRLLTAVSRGAAAGFILRGGITLFVSLLSLITKRKSESDRHPLLETLRMTLFLASLAGTYVLTDETIGAFFGKKNTSTWRGMVAGLAAGPSILLLG